MTHATNTSFSTLIIECNATFHLKAYRITQSYLLTVQAHGLSFRVVSHQSRSRAMSSFVDWSLSSSSFSLWFWGEGLPFLWTQIPLKCAEQTEHRRICLLTSCQPWQWRFEWAWLGSLSFLPLWAPSFSLITVLLFLGKQVILSLCFDDEKIAFIVIRGKLNGRQRMEITQEVRADHSCWYLWICHMEIKGNGIKVSTIISSGEAVESI